MGCAAEIDQERFDGARELRGALVGFRSQPETGLTDLVLRCSSKNGKVEDTVLLPRVSNQTYVVVLKVAVNADAPKNDFISYWVNPADLTDEAAATATAATLMQLRLQRTLMQLGIEPFTPTNDVDEG